MRFQIAYFPALVIALACLVTPASGQSDFLSLGPGSDQPINITSKKFEARNISGGKEMTFSGVVKVKQGDVTLEADKLVIVYDEEKGKAGSETQGKKLPKNFQSVSGIRSITASGKVKIVQNDRMATAGKAEYDNAKRTITLTEGPPQLWQGADVMAGNTIIIHLDENRSEVLGGDGPPISVRINPSKEKGKSNSREK